MQRMRCCRADDWLRKSLGTVAEGQGAKEVKAPPPPKEHPPLSRAKAKPTIKVSDVNERPNNQDLSFNVIMSAN